MSAMRSKPEAAGGAATSISARAPSAPRRQRRSLRPSFGTTALNVGVAAMMLIVIVPYFFMVSGSFKSNSEIYSIPLKILPSHLDLSNYRQLFEKSPYGRWYLNSMAVTAVRLALSLVICSGAGYALAKFDFRGKRIVFGMVLLTLLLPFEVLLVPLFRLMINLHWANNYLAIIVPNSISAYGVFLMRQFMLSIPDDLLDSARVDGASELAIFWRIALPLSRSGLVVLGIFFFTASWNDFLWPLIVLNSPHLFTLPLGISTLNGPYSINYGTVLAGATLSTIPILIVFLLLQRQFVAGLASGAVKG